MIRLKLAKFFQVLLISGLLFLVFSVKVYAAPAVIHKIDIQKDPLAVKIFLSRNISVKVIQVEKKELLIALTNVTLGKGFKIKEQEKSLVQRIIIEKMQGNVIAILLTGHQQYEHMQSGFNKSDSSFVLTLEKTRGKKEIEAPVPATKKEEPVDKDKNPDEDSASTINSASVTTRKTLPASKEEDDPESPKTKGTGKTEIEPERKKPEKIAAPPIYVPPKRVQNGNKGDISDLLRAVDGSGCDSNLVSNSLLLLKKDLYKEAFDSLDQYIIQGNTTCLEKAYFLKAYAF